MDWTFDLLHSPDGRTTEGPVWTGEELLFTQIQADRILRYDPGRNVITEWRSGTNHTNGLCFDANGQLFGCSARGRAIVRFDPDGRNTVVADLLDGKRLNTPNDLAIDSRGRIWFTDPVNCALWHENDEPELDFTDVLRADPQEDGDYVVSRVTFDTTQPNGILISPDEDVLYVAESGYAREVDRELRAYPILEDGTLGPYDVLFAWGADHRGVHRGIDGMCLDEDGNIVAANGWEVAGPGPMLTVFSPTGSVLEAHPIPADRPANVCFGGSDMRTVFVTSVAGHLLGARTDRRGWAMFP